MSTMEQALDTKSADALSASPELVRRPKIYDVTQPVPHERPYDLWYKEKVPALEVFRLCAMEAKAKAQDSFAGKLLTLMGIQPRFVAAECGVYRGHSLVACGKIARSLGLDARFIGLDSFEGLPPLSATDLELAPENIAYRNTHFFADAPYTEVLKTVEQAGLTDSITLVKGFFQDTLFALPPIAYDFVNIDCDLYEPHLQCLEYFYPRTRPGGILFFDDYHSADFPMARRAIDEFLSDKPEILLHLRFGDEGVNHTKSYIVKI